MKIRNFFILGLLSLCIFVAKVHAEKDIFFADAREQFMKGNFKVSETLFDQIIQKDPENAEAYNFRGASKLENFKYQSALQDFNKAIELDPQLLQVHCYRGNARFSLGDIQGAEKDLQTCLLTNPNPASYSDLARIKGMTGKFDEAISLANKAIELANIVSTPSILPFAYTNLASAYSAKGQYRESLTNIDKAIQLNPSIPDAYTVRAIDKVAIGDNHGAIDDLNKAIELNPKDANAFYNRAVLKTKIGDLPGSYSDLLQAKKNAIETNDKHMEKNAETALFQIESYLKK